MGSHRATHHTAYDKIFRPILGALRVKIENGEMPKVEGLFTKSKAYELCARFYTWRKLLHTYIEANNHAVDFRDLDDLDFAHKMRITKGKPDAQNMVQIAFYADNGADIHAALGIDLTELNAFTAQSITPRATPAQRLQTYADLVGKTMALPQARSAEDGQNNNSTTITAETFAAPLDDIPAEGGGSAEAHRNG